MRLQWSEMADKLHLYIFHCEVNNPHPHERRCLHYWTNPHALPRNFLRPIKICCSDEMTGLLEKKYALFLHGDWFTFHHTIYSIFNNYSSNKFCKLKNRFLSGQDPLLHSSTMGVHFLSRPLLFDSIAFTGLKKGESEKRGRGECKDEDVKGRRSRTCHVSSGETEFELAHCLEIRGRWLHALSLSHSTFTPREKSLPSSSCFFLPFQRLGPRPATSAHCP